MKDINKIFFELIRIAIGNQGCLSHTPSADEWGELYAMAKKQSLVGICFAGVQNLIFNHPSLIANLSESLRLQWIGMAAKIQQRNEVVNRQCVEVQKGIEADGFRTYIMKGQGNAALYTENLSMLRQSGDIDIYLEGGFEKVYDYVQRICPTKEVNELEIHYHILKDTDVEIHYRPFIMRNPIRNRILQKFLTEEGVKCFENKIALPNGAGQISVPTVSFNLVHQMVHIYHHLFTEGIGLRQLLDYYFLLKNTNCHKLPTNFSLIISELGLDRFASALMWVIGNVFEGNNNQNHSETMNLETASWIPWKPNEVDGRFLLNEIMMAGNFGHHDDRVPQRMSPWKSFWYLNWHNMRLLRFDPWFWFWTPLWRIYHFAWRKMKGFK